MSLNPYAPPTAPQRAPTPVQPAATCPRCGGHDIKKPAFTWWGGAVGPRMFDHRVCRSCKFGYSAKTGRSNTRAIVIYQGVMLAVAAVAVIAAWTWNTSREATAFVDGCARTCAQAGSSHADCQKMCECVAADLRRDGDVHFRQLLSEAARTGEAPRELGEAAARCRAQ